MMSLENPEQIVSIAPAEGQTIIMSDPNFELMCNPDKFCYGKGGFGNKRQRKITYRKYFNARLQDIDGRFADYLFVAQYTLWSISKYLMMIITLHGDRSLPSRLQLLR